jgi:hypothetical protein
MLQHRASQIIILIKLQATNELYLQLDQSITTPMLEFLLLNC